MIEQRTVLEGRRQGEAAPLLDPGAAKVPFSLSMLGWALNEEESIGNYIEKAQQCLAKSGKITFSLRERSATRLPQVLDNGEKID